MNKLAAAVQIYTRALRMNPQVVTYLVRTPSATPGNSASDSFTAYTLNRATFKSLDREERLAAGSALAATVKEWTLCLIDLENAGAPAPQVSYLIVDQSAGAFVGDLSSGGSVFSNVASTAGILPGMGAVGTNIPAGTTVVSVAANQVTLSQNASNTTTGVSLAFGDVWSVESVDAVVMDTAYIALCNRGR